MQITQDNKSTSSSLPTVVTPTILATPQVLKVTVSSPPSISSSVNTAISTTVPSLTSPSAVRGRVPTGVEQRKEEKQEQSTPIIKIEIDDPSYEEYTESKPSTSSKTMTTVTPPPRVTNQRTSDEFHVNERLTKSASPQLMTGNYDSYTSQRIEDDAKSRANQQFRLNKAIGKIANLRSQAAVSRAPRKPSVVFHRPSSNSTPIPFKVRHDASFAKSQHREDIRPQPHPLSVHSNGRVPNQFQRVQGRSIPNKGHRSLQMMRAARNAQLRSLMRSGLYKLQPSALSNVRAVNNVNNRRRMAARMQRQEIVAPLYYPSDLEEEDFLPELEIDPPDNYNVNEDISDHSEDRREPQRNESDNNQLLRDIFQEMTKEMRQLSQHMETIHGQLQVIIDRLPPVVDNNQRKVPSPHHQHTPGSNGVTNIETTSPLSNDEHSPDPLDDGDDNLGEGINGQERPLDAVDFRELPLLGTPESDALIREVVDDGRWDQMTPYAGAPRLAIALARYCIFGTKVLIESSVTGRNSKNPLNHVSMRKIKELLKEKYGSRCNQLEFEMVWKTSRESISQLCKRLRRKFQMTGRVSGGQEDFILDCRQ